jgi:hypothetical protein
VTYSPLDGINMTTTEFLKCTLFLVLRSDEVPDVSGHVLDRRRKLLVLMFGSDNVASLGDVGMLRLSRRLPSIWG